MTFWNAPLKSALLWKTPSLLKWVTALKPPKIFETNGFYCRKPQEMPSPRPTKIFRLQSPIWKRFVVSDKLIDNLFNKNKFSRLTPTPVTPETAPTKQPPLLKRCKANSTSCRRSSWRMRTMRRKSRSKLMPSRTRLQILTKRLRRCVCWCFFASQLKFDIIS